MFSSHFFPNEVFLNFPWSTTENKCTNMYIGLRVIVGIQAYESRRWPSSCYSAKVCRRAGPYYANLVNSCDGPSSILSIIIQVNSASSWRIGSGIKRTRHRKLRSGKGLVCSSQWCLMLYTVSCSWYFQLGILLDGLLFSYHGSLESLSYYSTAHKICNGSGDLRVAITGESLVGDTMWS